MHVRTAVTVMLAAGTLFAACGDDDGTGTSPTDPGETAAPETSEATTPTAASVDPVFAQLCGVLRAALEGEVAVARRTFDHGPLHTLADEVIDVDRGVAARLLEAKEAVESDLAAAGPDAAALVTDLEALTAATGDALVAAGTPVTPTCDLEAR